MQPRFHHTSQIWGPFSTSRPERHRQIKPQHIQQFIISRCRECSTCTLFLLLCTNENAHSGDLPGIHLCIKNSGVSKLCAWLWKVLRLDRWWTKVQGNVFFIYPAVDDIFSTLYCLSAPLPQMPWFKDSMESCRSCQPYPRDSEVPCQRKEITDWG